MTPALSCWGREVKESLNLLKYSADRLREIDIKKGEGIQNLKNYVTSFMDVPQRDRQTGEEAVLASFFSSGSKRGRGPSDPHV